MDATNAGTAYAYISGIGDYSGIIKVGFTIEKADNGIIAKAKTANFKFSKIRKRDITFNISKLLKVSNAAGKITYQKSAGNKKITIDPKTGKVTLKKGLKKGKYIITVKIEASGDDNYESKTISRSMRIIIK